MFSNLINSAKDAVNTVAKSIEEQNRPSQEQQGQSSEVEEIVSKVDSKGGKVQVTTVADSGEKTTTTVEKEGQGASGGAQFFSGLISVAQEVGKYVDKAQKDQAAKVAEEEIVGTVDSQGGKVQVTTVTDTGDKQTTTVEKEGKPSGDFLAGLIGVAQDVAKSIGDNANKTADAAKSGAQTVGDGTKKTADAGVDELGKLGQNVGNLIGGFFSKEKDEKKADDEFKSHAVIDDIEGEIGKVTTTGTTASKDELGDIASDPGPIKEVPSEDTSFRPFESLQDLGHRASDTVKEGARTTGDTFSSAFDSAKEFGKSAVVTTKEVASDAGDALSSAFDTAKELGKTTVDITKETAADVADATKERVHDVSDAISSAADSAKEIGTSAFESAKEKTEKTTEAVKEQTRDVSDAFSTVYEHAKELGHSAKDAAAERVAHAADVFEEKKNEVGDDFSAVRENVKELGSSAADTTKEGFAASVDAEKGQYVASAYDSAKDTGTTVVENTKEGVTALADAAKEGAQAFAETFSSVYDHTKDIGSAVVETTKENVATVADSTKHGAQAFSQTLSSAYDHAKDIGSSAAESAKEKVAVAKTVDNSAPEEEYVPVPTSQRRRGSLFDTMRDSITNYAGDTKKLASGALSKIVGRILGPDGTDTPDELTGNLVRHSFEDDDLIDKLLGLESQGETRRPRYGSNYIDFENEAAVAAGKLEQEETEGFEMVTAAPQESSSAHPTHAPPTERRQSSIDVIYDGAANLSHRFVEAAMGGVEIAKDGAHSFVESARTIGGVVVEGVSEIPSATYESAEHTDLFEAVPETGGPVREKIGTVEGQQPADEAQWPDECKNFEWSLTSIADQMPWPFANPAQTTTAPGLPT